MDFTKFAADLEDFRTRMTRAEIGNTEVAVHAARAMGSAVLVGALLDQLEAEFEFLANRAQRLLIGSGASTRAPINGQVRQGVPGPEDDDDEFPAVIQRLRAQV